MIKNPKRSGYIALKVEDVGWIRPPYHCQSSTQRPFRKTRKPLLVERREKELWIQAVEEWCEKELKILEIYELERPRFI